MSALPYTIEELITVVLARSFRDGEVGFTGEDGVVDAIEKVTDLYLAERQEGERFLDTYRRLGMKPFKEAIYG